MAILLPASRTQTVQTIVRHPALLLAALLPIATLPLAAQDDPSRLTVQRIFASQEFRPDFFGPARWLDQGVAYTTLEKAAEGSGRDIVRYETSSGARTVHVSARALTPAGDTTAIDIENYDWSADGTRLLVFTNSKPVWRQNNRGDYWVLDRTSGTLRKLGGAEARPSTLLFAKFSPDGRRVGYVRENNLYVEDLASGAITQLTRDGSRTLINGTFDWVYEEELDLRDGWRWSPDGQRIAFWQLNADRVRDFDLINNTDSLYSFVVPVQYPKAGETNSAARIGVIPAAGGTVTWLPFEGDPREHYLARMEWAESSDELIIQRLNRLQNRNEVVLADARTGALRPVLVEEDSAWVDVVDDLVFLKAGKQFTWMSERDGWEHAYVVSRDGRDMRLVTPGTFDVLNVLSVDDKGGWVYYIASPESPAQRFLWRTRLDGKGKAERLTPASQAGVHTYDIAPDHRYAWHSWSRFGEPWVTELVRLPGHDVVRTVVSNEKLKARVAALRRGPAEFVQVDIGNGVNLNAWVMKPADFDPGRKYPVLFHVYGGPGSQTVMDAWGGSQYLWHAMLTQQGYIVASVDNRGTGARGRAWRKIIYGRLGVVETDDQAAAARAMAARYPYIDSTRMGIWGWSYGGFMSLNALFRYPDVYRTAVAVAPVTHWSYYDNIYTERYNGLPQENAAGYDAGSPLTHVDQMRGNLLVIHGSGDDNVHYQNTQALMNKLVAANKQFTMMEYPNRNHGIFGGNTSRHLRDLITRYLQENLLAPTPKNYTF
jgi:dipeptidyl-peptidase-4